MVLARDERYNKLIKEYLVASEKIYMSLDGKALIQMGVKEGPEIGQILDQVRLAWLQGRIHTLEEEQEIVRRRVDTLR